MNIFSFLTIDEDHTLQLREPYFESLKVLGYSIEFIADKYEGFQNIVDGYEYLITHKNDAISLMESLESYTFNKFKTSMPDSATDKQNQYQLFLANLAIDSIQDERLKDIFLKIQSNQLEHPQSLINYFEAYLSWINLFIERMEISIERNDLDKSDEQKRTILSHFEGLENDIEGLNKKIKLYEERQLATIKKKIIESVVELYETKYKKEFPVKKDFFRIVHPHLKLSVEWKLDSFIKYAESRS